MVTLFMAFLLASAASFPALEAARDTQDRATLQRITSESAAAAAKQPGDPAAQYRHAVSASYLAEVALEQRDKTAAKNAAEEGIGAAEKAVALRPADF